MLGGGARNLIDLFYNNCTIGRAVWLNLCKSNPAIFVCRPLFFYVRISNRPPKGEGGINVKIQVVDTTAAVRTAQQSSTAITIALTREGRFSVEEY